VKCNIMHAEEYEACSIIPWRSCYPSHEPPRETLDIVTRTKRPRHTDVDVLLDTNVSTKFMITHIIRTTRNGFSQVFLGHLEGSFHQICLKLFDERLFPMPEHPDYHHDSSESPEERLLDLNFADDMMCREEAVYNDRLHHLQGSMIPHCYGFHMFVLPDQWEVYGFFMEFIQGPTLSSYLPQIQMDKESLRVLLKRFRHTVRAMKFAGVHQGDWHFDQVICSTLQDGNEVPDLVLIDFAFAPQHLGENGTPCQPDVGYLKMTLKVDMKIDATLLDECWHDAVWQEY